jgi:hypothetical protein
MSSWSIVEQSPSTPQTGQNEETALYSLDDYSISNPISTESTDDFPLDSALIAETASCSSIAHSSRRTAVLVNGLTAEELIDSIRFESDCEGSLGFYGPREFERDQERRRKEAHAKREREKLAAKAAKAAKTTTKAAMDSTQGIGVGSSERLRGIVSTFWSQMTQTTITTPSAITTD